MRILFLGVAPTVKIHAVTNPKSTIDRGSSFSDIGRIEVLHEYGSSHKVAAPPHTDDADMTNIGITTLLFSEIELSGLCVRGPHVVTIVNRTE